MFFISTFHTCYSQITNYINNGSFEDILTNTNTPTFYSAKYWGGIDSSKYYGVTLSGITNPIQVPQSSYTYQTPKHGFNYFASTIFSNFQNNNRGYPRNRLKTTLDAGTEYCLSMYVNLTNNSVHAIDAIGVYFGDISIDTISQCNKPITYLSPQVQNATKNIITDTLNWILIQGQFTANGTEKYALIGNFQSNNNTNTVVANPTHSPAIASEYLLDYISLIELNLPAFAGRDTVVFAGDSVFVGREPDVGIDEACTWFKLPGTAPIDTIAGFWVKPVETSIYVVRQEICGLVKWDTVRIYMDAVGLDELNLGNRWQLRIFPNPAQDQLSITNNNNKYDILDITITDLTGRIVKKQQLKCSGHTGTLEFDLTNGAYFLTIRNSLNETVTKQILIAK